MTCAEANLKRAGYIFTVCASLAVLLWFFPAFHVVPLKQAMAAKEQGVFNAADFAAKFWNERLSPALSHAPDAATILAALDQNPKAAATNYGHTPGMSDTVYYFMRGTGTVVSVESHGVGVVVRDGTTKPDLLLKTGLLFGNTVRDATGLLSAGDFPNSQNFNDVSTELNRRVEARVQPALRTEARVGATVIFAGCLELAEEESDARPLKLVPLQIEFIAPK